MILFEAKYHFKKAIFIGTIFLWNVFLFWVIWFTYSSDKMSTLHTIVKDYDKNIVLRDCQSQAFEYLHKKLSHDRSLLDHVFWDYFWDVYRDREPARTDNSVWEIGTGDIHYYTGSFDMIKTRLPYLGLYNVHCPWKSPEKKLVRVYNAYGLLKKSPSEM
jgi:hypothetical protein